MTKAITLPVQAEALRIRWASTTRASTALTDLLRQDMSTVEGIAAAAVSLHKAMLGYMQPVVHGTGILSVSGSLSIEAVNGVGHDFPCLMLAWICNHLSGTEAVALSGSQLELAVCSMSPAEKCGAFRHPNIGVWRRILERLRSRPSDTAIAVFVEDAANATDEIARAFVRAHLSISGH